MTLSGVLKGERLAFFKLLTAILLIYSVLDICNSQLPAVCTNSLNFYQQICCPEPFVGAGPCGSNLLISRGKCVSISTDQTIKDVRGNWPHYYKQICECEPQFGNYDCGECASGFKGANCDEKIIRTRKLINHLSKSELDHYIKTLFMAKTFPSRYVAITSETQPGSVPNMKPTSVYNMFVWVHYYISKESYVYDFGHGGPGFPIWHRQYLMWFEREIQWMLGNDSHFAFPFWDWSSEKHRMYPFQEHILGASDKNGNLIGNFANWTTVCTNSSTYDADTLCDPSTNEHHMTRFRTYEVYAANYTQWPRRKELCKAMTMPVYDSQPYNTLVDEHKGFRNFMEGFYVGNETCDTALFTCVTNTSRLQLHNQVHNMINGTITAVPGASNDPLFILHHGFVDYILEMWIRRYHGEFKPSPKDTSAAKGHNYNDLIVPFLPLVRAHEMLVESTNLGWTYESLKGIDIDSLSCETDVVHPETAPGQSETVIHEFKPGRLNDKTKQLQKREELTATSIDNFFNVTGKLSDASHKVVYNICTLNSKQQVFQIPQNCDELIFPSNLVLPRSLIPLGLYKCSQLSLESGLQFCTLKP